MVPHTLHISTQLRITLSFSKNILNKTQVECWMNGRHPIMKLPKLLIEMLELNISGDMEFQGGDIIKQKLNTWSCMLSGY